MLGDQSLLDRLWEKSRDSTPAFLESYIPQHIILKFYYVELSHISQTHYV